MDKHAPGCCAMISPSVAVATAITASDLFGALASGDSPVSCGFLAIDLAITQDFLSRTKCKFRHVTMQGSDSPMAGS